MAVKKSTAAKAAPAKKNAAAKKAAPAKKTAAAKKAAPANNIPKAKEFRRVKMGIIGCGMISLLTVDRISTRLMESMILPVAISVRMMLLCLPMISKIIFFDTEKPSSFMVSTLISMIRSEPFC